MRSSAWLALLCLTSASCASANEIAEDVTPVKTEVYLAVLDALAREHPDELLWLRNGSKRALLPFLFNSHFRSLSDELHVIWTRMEEERDDWQAFSAAMQEWRPKLSEGGQSLEFLLSPVILSQDRQRAAVVCGIECTYLLALLSRNNGVFVTVLEGNPIIH